MINTIIENLCITFRSSGENVNIQIHNSEEILLNLSNNIEFYPALFSIIQSKEIPNEIRKAALIYLQYLVNRWTTSLPEQAKIFIIENFPLLLKNSLQYLKIDLKLTENLINCTFFAGNSWLNIFDIINSGFCNFEKEKEQAFVSIILLNSISRFYKNRPNIPPNPIINNFYPFLQNFIIFSLDHLFDENGQNNNFLPFVSICYQTIRFLNLYTLSQYFIVNVDHFNQLLFQTTRIAFFEKMNCDIEEFLFFSKKVIKFTSKMIQKYPERVNVSISIQILQSFFEFFQKFRNNESILNSSAVLINAFLFYQPTYQFIMENNCSNFIIKLIFPFFYLNEQDIENSKYDPSQFLAKFQTKDFFFESESRAYLYQTLIQKSSDLCNNNENHEFPHFCICIFQIFNKVVNNYINSNDNNHSESENAILFSIFFLFSTIHPSIPYLNNELFAQLVNLLSQLINSPSHLVISGVLILLKCISSSLQSSYLFPSNFYIHVAQLLISHPSQLVRYYASSTFFEMIDHVSQSNENNNQKKNIFDSCSQLLPDILKSFIELSSVFNDFEFIETMSNVMIIFSSILINVAPQLIIQVFQLFLNYQNSSLSNSTEFYKGQRIIDSLFKFIAIILKENQRNNYAFSEDMIMTPLLSLIFQVLNSDSLNIQSLHIIFEFIARLSLVSSFDFSDQNENINENNQNDSVFHSLFALQIKRRKVTISPFFWKIYEIIPQIIERKGFELIEDGLYAMRSIFVSNPEFSMNGDVLNFTLQVGNKFLNQFLNEFSDELYATMLFISTIFIITPPQTIQNVNELYQHLIPILRNFFQNYETLPHSSILTFSMMIQNPTAFFQIIKMIPSNNNNKNDPVVQFCLEWVDISDCFLIMLFILNFHQAFSPEINCIFIKKVLSSFGIDNDDDDDDLNIFISPNKVRKSSPCSMILFDSQKILFYFSQFMQSISQTFPELTAKFNEELHAVEYYLNNDDNDFDQQL